MRNITTDQEARTRGRRQRTDPKEGMLWGVTAGKREMLVFAPRALRVASVLACTASVGHMRGSHLFGSGPLNALPFFLLIAPSSPRQTARWRCALPGPVSFLVIDHRSPRIGPPRWREKREKKEVVYVLHNDGPRGSPSLTWWSSAVTSTPRSLPSAPPLAPPSPW